MKMVRISIIAIVFLLAGIAVQADPVRGKPFFDEEAALDNPDRPDSEAKREEVRKKIEAVRMWRLTEALKLDEKTSTRLASFLSSLQEKRRALMRSNRTTIGEIRTSLKAPQPDERTLKARLETIEKNQRELLELREKELKGVREILSIEQQARYVVFQQEFRREVRRMIAGARGNGPARGPQRQPNR